MFRQHFNLHSTAVDGAILVAIGVTLMGWLSPQVWNLQGSLPITPQSLIMVLWGVLWGWQVGTAAVLTYLLVGGIGLPVFAGTPEKGIGISYMIGPTGGYLVGFIASVFIAGFVNLNKNIFVKFSLISLAIFAIYITGVPWLAYLAGWEVAYIWGIKNFVLAEVLKISILVLSTEKLLKIRKFI